MSERTFYGAMILSALCAIGVGLIASAYLHSFMASAGIAVLTFVAGLFLFSSMVKQ